MSGQRRYSTSDERWDDRVEVIAKSGWSLDDLRLRASLSPWDRRRFEQAVTDLEQQRPSEPPPGHERIGSLTTEQAEALYQRYGSYRKAAAASGYGPTHLRRKRLNLP